MDRAHLQGACQLGVAVGDVAGGVVCERIHHIPQCGQRLVDELALLECHALCPGLVLPLRPCMHLTYRRLSRDKLAQGCVSHTFKAYHIAVTSCNMPKLGAFTCPSIYVAVMSAMCLAVLLELQARLHSMGGVTQEQGPTCQVHQGKLAMHEPAVRQVPLHSQRDQAVRAAAGSVRAGGRHGAPGQPLLRQHLQLALVGNRHLLDNQPAWSE